MSFIHENTPVTPEQARLLAFRDITHTLAMIDGVLSDYLIDPLGTVTFRFMQTFDTNRPEYNRMKHLLGERIAVVSRVKLENGMETYKVEVLRDGKVTASKLHLQDEEQIGAYRIEDVKEDIGVSKDYSEVKDFAKITEEKLIDAESKSVVSKPQRNGAANFPM